MGTECPKCHTDNPDTEKFWGDCGAPLPKQEEIVLYSEGINGLRFRKTN